MDLHKSLNHLLLALIVGIASMGVSFIAQLSNSVQHMAVSVQELNMRMSRVGELTSDHEARIRAIEKSRPSKY